MNKIVLLIFIISFSVFHACEENPEQFTLGKDYLEPQLGLTLIDTFSVELSTVILDEVITADNNVLLVGNYSDSLCGVISSNSYFQIGLPDSVDILDDDVYDSTTLLLTYNNYSFGDTTVPQKIWIHQLSEKIEVTNSDSLDSHSTFNYKPTPLGFFQYIPKPNGVVDTISIRVSDDIGLDLFTKQKENSVILSNEESFLSYFYGLVLVSDPGYPGSIIGFSGNDEDVRLQLHYSRSNTTIKHMMCEFNLTNTSKQFNNINHDFLATRLSNLTEQRYELSSKYTNGLSILQGGIGLAIKINFPSLSEIMFMERGTIAEAELIIAPQTGSYNDNSLTGAMTLYTSDKYNNYIELVLNSQGLVASPTITIDDQYHENTTYSFDISQYLIDELQDSYIDSDDGLLLIPSSGSLENRFDRFVADIKNINTKLKIYYITY